MLKQAKCKFVTQHCKLVFRICFKMLVVAWVGVLITFYNVYKRIMLTIRYLYKRNSVKYIALQ